MTDLMILLASVESLFGKMPSIDISFQINRFMLVGPFYERFLFWDRLDIISTIAVTHYNMGKTHALSIALIAVHYLF